MQTFRWLIIFGILALLAPALRGDTSKSFLLTKEDEELEFKALEEGKPALSSSLREKEQWESYNEWRCFPAKLVELTCSEIEYDGWRKSPSIVAIDDGHRFEYDLDPTFRWDCEFTLSEWRQVIGNSLEVCLFGAFLQPLDGDASLWMLSQLKSEHSYWKEYESEAYRRTQNADDDDRDHGEDMGTSASSGWLAATWLPFRSKYVSLRRK